MKLQTATRLGLFAVLELASHPLQQLSGAEIADKFNVSSHHLSKVLRRLVSSGLVEAVRGVGGGYRFCGNPKRTTLMDIIELFEPLREIKAQGSIETGADVVDALELVLTEIDDTIQATLNSISINTLIKIMHRNKGKQ